MRPSIYDFATIEAICLELAEGKPLEQICREHPEYPAARTIREWALTKQDVSAAIARARELGEEAIAAQCLVIADTPVKGEETTVKANGDVEVKTGDMLGHRKLQIETRLKLLAKWNPKKWGDRLNVDANVTRKAAQDLTDDELSDIAAGRRARVAGASDGLPEPGELS